MLIYTLLFSEKIAEKRNVVLIKVNPNKSDIFVMDMIFDEL